jgi:hypothetical protein
MSASAWRTSVVHNARVQDDGSLVVQQRQGFLNGEARSLDGPENGYFRAFLLKALCRRQTDAAVSSGNDRHF